MFLIHPKQSNHNMVSLLRFNRNDQVCEASPHRPGGNQEAEETAGRREEEETAGG